MRHDEIETANKNHNTLSIHYFLIYLIDVAMDEMQKSFCHGGF